MLIQPNQPRGTNRKVGAPQMMSQEVSLRNPIFNDDPLVVLNDCRRPETIRTRSHNMRDCTFHEPNAVEEPARTVKYVHPRHGLGSNRGIELDPDVPFGIDLNAMVRRFVSWEFGDPGGVFGSP
jgi:hypothetical protein